MTWAGDLIKRRSCEIEAAFLWEDPDSWSESVEQAEGELISAFAVTGSLIFMTTVLAIVLPRALWFFLPVAGLCFWLVWQKFFPNWRQL